MKYIKRLFFFLLFLITLLGVWLNKEIPYLYAAAKGQLKVLTQAQDLKEWSKQDSVTPDQLLRIQWIEEIKQFTKDSLGFEPDKAYTTIYDQKGKPILWGINAAQPFALESYYWEYPVLGKLSYRGYFVEEQAEQEIGRLQNLGYDVEMREVSAWSTLGYLNDPVLSDFLNYSEPALASLIIHELLHREVYLPGSTSFNENIASFVGKHGAIWYLQTKYGSDSQEIKMWEKRKERSRLRNEFFMQEAQRLKAIYVSIQNHSIDEKQKEKALFFQSFTDSVNAKFNTSFEQGYFNNAHFMGYATYYEKSDSLELAFQNNFNGDLKAIVDYWKTLD